MGQSSRRRVAATVAVGVLAALTSACSDEAETATGDGLTVDGAWARSSPMLANAGAAYMELTSVEGDRLIAASVDGEVAGTVEIHETVALSEATGDSDDTMEEDTTDTMGGTTEDGAMEDGAMDDGAMEDGAMGDEAMTMREMADGLELPAGETVALEPGGYHVMLLEMPDPLEAGETFDLELTFEQAGTRTVSVEVRDDAP